METRTTSEKSSKLKRITKKALGLVGAICTVRVVSGGIQLVAFDW